MIYIFASVVIACLIGFVVLAVLDFARTSGLDQDTDEHEQGGI